MKRGAMNSHLGFYSNLANRSKNEAPLKSSTANPNHELKEMETLICHQSDSNWPHMWCNLGFNPLARKTEGPRAYSCYIGRPARVFMASKSFDL